MGQGSMMQWGTGGHWRTTLKERIYRSTLQGITGLLRDGEMVRVLAQFACWVEQSATCYSLAQGGVLIHSGPKWGAEAARVP